MAFRERWPRLGGSVALSDRRVINDGLLPFLAASPGNNVRQLRLSARSDLNNCRREVRRLCPPNLRLKPA
jgi:hypothetical protein